MSIEFSGKKTFPLVYNVNDNEVAILFDSYAVNEAFNVVAGDPEKWMAGREWDVVTERFTNFLGQTENAANIQPQIRISSDQVKSIIKGVN